MRSLMVEHDRLLTAWDAFPRLEILKIRGSQGLSLGKIRHRHLKELYRESGGLGSDVLAEVAAAQLPEL